jgi:hypothetical protein
MVDSRTETLNASEAPNGWNEAIEYSNVLGPISPVLPAIVRPLLADERNNQGQLSAITKYQVGRICCGANFKAMLYHFTRVAAPEYLSDRASVTVGDLIDLYKPLDISTLIASFSLSRIVRKRVPPELFALIRPHLAREAQIGALTGVAIPTLGLGRGILWGTLPHICHALMSAHDPSTYTRWRKSLSNSSIKERTVKEREMWGTSSAQVASMILVKVGFPTQLAQTLALASDYCGGLATIQDAELRLTRIALLWFESLINGQEAPHEPIPAAFFPFQNAQASVDATIRGFTSPDQSWIERTSADISTEKTPQLFTEAASKSKDLEVPGQLKEIFTVDSLTKIDEWQFDALVNHIDKEIANGNISSDGESAAANELDNIVS